MTRVTFSRPGRRRWVRRGAASLTLFWALSASGGSTAEERSKRPAEILPALVRELIDLELESSSEETRWREERVHLETTLSLLKKENDALDRAIDAARVEGEAAEKEARDLEKGTAAVEAALRQVDGALERAAGRLGAVFAALPDSLRQPLDAGATRLREAFKGDRREETVPDRVRLVAGSSADLQRILTSVHAVKETHDIGTGERQELDVLYLGGAIGYYVSPDGRHAGMILREDSGWRVLSRDTMAPAVRQALAIHRKEKPARLLRLPVVAGGAP